MRYFYRLTQGVMVFPLMDALSRQPELWNEDDVRTTFEGTPHAAADDILLRFGKADGDDLEAWDRPAIRKLRGAKQTALDIMQLVGGSRLGRVVITRLAPGDRIMPHADVKGAYSSYYTRYHVVLQGMQGSVFTCGDEAVNMLTGEVWWFNAAETHSVVNNSADDRVHLLVDTRIDP